MDDDMERARKRDPHLHHAPTGTKHGVPAGAAQEEGTGYPNSDRQVTETGPIHPEEK